MSKAFENSQYVNKKPVAKTAHVTNHNKMFFDEDASRPYYLDPEQKLGGDDVNFPVPEIDTDNIVNSAVTTLKIDDEAVTEIKLAAGSVTTDKIFNGAVTNVKIAPGAVGTTHLAETCVGTIHLITGSVTTDKIFNGAVTNDKIANDTITESKLAFQFLPVGLIAPFYGIEAPSGWLHLNGSLIDGNSYLDLFNYVKSNNALFVPIASWSSNKGKFGYSGGTSLYLPDFRAMFLRGWNEARADGFSDPEASREIGSTQSQNVGPHTHNVTVAAAVPGDGANGGNDISSSVVYTTTNPSAPNGVETRPNNVAIMYIIKY